VLTLTWRGELHDVRTKSPIHDGEYRPSEAGRVLEFCTNDEVQALSEKINDLMTDLEDQDLWPDAPNQHLSAESSV